MSYAGVGLLPYTYPPHLPSSTLMPKATGKWLRQATPSPSFAKVDLSVDPAPSTTIVILRRPLTEPHDSEAPGVPAIGYDDWVLGAFIGATFALAAARAEQVRVEIQRLVGTHVDTTVGAMAAAAALGVWTALAWEPPPEARAKLERAAFEGRDSIDAVRAILSTARA